MAALLRELSSLGGDEPAPAPAPTAGAPKPRTSAPAPLAPKKRKGIFGR